MNERDFKFNSFAVLLFDEILPLMQAWKTAHREHDYARVQVIEAQIQDVFTCRGYDLVGHAMDHLSAYAYDTAGSGQELWDTIPDMKEWPKF